MVINGLLRMVLKSILDLPSKRELHAIPLHGGDYNFSNHLLLEIWISLVFCYNKNPVVKTEQTNWRG